jgi:hypothetical protein
MREQFIERSVSSLGNRRIFQISVTDEVDAPVNPRSSSSNKKQQTGHKFLLPWAGFETPTNLIGRTLSSYKHRDLPVDHIFITYILQRANLKKYEKLYDK